MRRTRATRSWLLILVSLLACSFGESVAAGPDASPIVLKLGPLIQEALDRNPELAAAREQVKAMKERVPQARTLDDPEVKIQLWNTPETLDLTRTQRTIYGLAQQFPFPGVLSQQGQIATREAEQATHSLAAKER